MDKTSSFTRLQHRKSAVFLWPYSHRYASFPDSSLIRKASLIVLWKSPVVPTFDSLQLCHQKFPEKKWPRPCFRVIDPLKLTFSSVFREFDRRNWCVHWTAAFCADRAMLYGRICWIVDKNFRSEISSEFIYILTEFVSSSFTSDSLLFMSSKAPWYSGLSLRQLFYKWRQKLYAFAELVSDFIDRIYMNIREKGDRNDPIVLDCSKRVLEGHWRPDIFERM